MTVRLVLPMATRRTTNGLIKGHSRQPGILQRGKIVFSGRVETRGTRISSGCTSDIATRNTSRSDFEPFEKTPVVHRRGFSLPGSRFFVGTRIFADLQDHLLILMISVHLRPILDYRVVPFTSRSFFWFSCYWALRPLMCFANFKGAPPWRLTTGRSRHSSAGISVARSITKHESPNVRGTFVSIACILADIRIRLRAGFQVRGSPHPH